MLCQLHFISTEQNVDTRPRQLVVRNIVSSVLDRSFSVTDQGWHLKNGCLEPVEQDANWFWKKSRNTNAVESPGHPVPTQGGGKKEKHETCGRRRSVWWKHMRAWDAVLLLQKVHMPRRQIGCECKWGQGRDGMLPFCLHFSRHLTTAGKVGTLAQHYPPHCPLPGPQDWDWRKRWPVKHKTYFGTAFLENSIKAFNTWGRRCPLEDLLSDWSARRKWNGSAWRGPDQQVRAGGCRVVREGKNLLNREEECQ